jgi:hypothetical protein
MLPFSDVHPIAVIAAAVASMVIGMVWYSPSFLGKEWMKLSGVSPKASMKGAGKSMVLGFIVELIGAYVLALLVAMLSPPSVPLAALAAILLWIAVGFPVQIGAVLWEQKKPKLFFINASYTLVKVIVIVVILTAWQI